MYQAIVEGDLDTVNDLYLSGSYSDLTMGDDVGNTPAFLACLFDRPEVLRFLHKNGVDLNRPCDAAKFGNSSFFAMHYGKTQILTDLWEMGYDIGAPCDKFGFPPIYYAELKKDEIMVAHLKMLQSRGTMQDVKATIIERCTRGLFARNFFRAKKKEKERCITAQIMIAAPWRGGCVRMANNRRELAAETEAEDNENKNPEIGGEAKEIEDKDDKEEGKGDEGDGEQTEGTG